jgi:hypothetical protein
MDSDSALLASVVAGVSNATDLEGALNAIVDPLHARLMLWHATVTSHATGAAEVTVLATWSMVDSLIEAGMQVSATISPVITRVLETLRQGQMASFDVGGDPGSLLDHVLHEQGVACVLALPLQVDEEAVVVLTLGSSTAGIFHEPMGGFFSLLAAGIRAPMLRLATAANG